LGVDGGATKTVALVTDGAGEVLGSGRAGSSDIHAEGASAEAAISEIVAAVREATGAAGLRPTDLDRSVFSLCGADWPEDTDVYAGLLTRSLGLQATPTILNDAFGALRAGTPDGIGVALVLGTGAAVAAQGPGLERWFSGFRIESSGAQEFGRFAYEALIRGEYGSGPEPGFTSVALAAFGVTSVEALVNRVTRSGGLGSRSLTRLAAILLDASHLGDPLARGYIRAHGHSLGGYVRSAAARVFPPGAEPLVVTSGGVFRHRCTDLGDAIAAELSGFQVVRSTVEPVFGSVLLAADEHGLRPSLDRMRATGPAAVFFDTA
jgi:N-acetylglucosamine kinase-like BadF-type ATPase